MKAKWTTETADPPCTCSRHGRRRPLHDHTCPQFLIWSNRPVKQVPFHDPAA